MTDPTKPNFNPGGLIDRIDLRDYQWQEIAGGIATYVQKEYKGGPKIVKAARSCLAWKGY